MLGLDVQETSQLHSLESSLSNTVNHKWPILHVHFIDEPISKRNIKGDLTTENREHPLPQTDIVNSAEFIQEPAQTSFTGSQDCRGNDSLNSAVMLGTVERLATMDISSATQTIDHQELVGSSAMQDKEDCLEIGIHPEVSAEWHVKDKQALSEPEEAYMEDISSEIGLHSEQNAKQDIMQPDRKKSSDSKETDSSAKLTEICSLMVTEIKNSFDQPPGGPEKCNVVMSSEHTCLTNDLKGGGSCMCLEDQKVLLCSCTSHYLTKRNPDVPDINNGPVLCEEAIACKESKGSDFGEIDTGSKLLTSPKESSTENGTRPKENSLVHAVENVTKSKDICVQQSLDITSCSEGQHKTDGLCKPLSNTHLVRKVETSFEDTSSQNNPDDLFSECGKWIHSEATTIQPDLQTSTEQLSAKSQDTQECSFVQNTREHNLHLQSGSADCQEDLSCANNLSCKLDQSSNSCAMALVSAKNTCGEYSCKDTTSNLLADDNEISAVHFVESDATLQKITIKIKEQLQVVESFQAEKVLITKRGPSFHDSIMTQAMHCTTLQDNQLPHILNEAKLPVACSTSQMPEPHSILPNLGCDRVKSRNIVTSPGSVIRIKNDKSPKQQAESNLASDISDSENSDTVVKLDNSILFGHSQSSANNKTILSSHNFKEVPPPECHSTAPVTCPLKNTLQNALVPYVDIWSFLTKPRVSDVLSLNSTNNMILKKVKCQKPELRNNFSRGKESRFLYAKACSVPHRLPGWKNMKHALLVHSSACLGSIKALLLKCPKDTYKVPKNLFYDHSAWNQRVEKSYKVPSVVPTITQTKWFSSSGSEAVNLNLTACSGDVRSLQGSTSNTLVSVSCFQKTKTHPPLSNSHIVQRTALQADVLDSSLTNSNMENTRRMKQVVSIIPMVTRSRNKIQYKDPSECLHILKPAEPSTSPKDPTTKMQSILFGEQKPQFQLLRGQSRKKLPLEMASGTLKRKRVCIKTQNTLTTNNKPLPLQCDQQLQKDCLRQPACSQMEMKEIRVVKGIQNCTLKLEPQSLTCTIQGTKRPKTSHKNFGQPSSSDIQGCIDASSHKTFIQHSHSRTPSCKIQNVPELPRNDYMTGDLSLRKQPSRKCKSSFIQENNVPNSRRHMCELSKAFHAHTSNHRLLPSKSAGSKRTYNTLHAKVIRRDVVTYNKCTSETGLLQQLSAIASRLTAPCKSSPRSTPLSNTTKLVPFRGVQLQAKKLLNVFSCVNMQVSSQSAGSVGSSSRDHLLSQCMDLWPAHLAKVCPDFLGGSFSFPTLDSTTFPVSFHMKVDPGFLSDFIKLSPPDYMFKSVLPITQSAQLSEWTLSFFLSSHFPATNDDLKLFTHRNPHFKFLGPSESHSSCRSKSERKSGCSMLGLHTVLALSSPGCYRLWTRKRNLGSRIPTVQKLSVTQFAHGLKGLPPPFSWKREISSSLAFALGRVMSVWSRHGLSAFSSDVSTPHPHCSSWQPSQSLGISVPARRPNTDLIPKKCFTVNEARHQVNVTSWEEKYFRPSHCTSTLSNHASCLFLEKGGGRGSSCSLFNKQGKDDQPLHCLPSPQQENPVCLPSLQTKDVDPPQSLSSEQSNDLGHLNCPSIDQGDDSKPPNFLFNERAKNLLSPDSVNFLSPDQEREFGPSACLSVQQEDALTLTNSVPLDQANACGPLCQVSVKQVDCFGPSFSLSIEQSDGHLCGVSIEHGSGLEPLYNLSDKQHHSTKPQHYLIAHQDVPQFPHCLTIEQKMGLGHSEVFPSEQVDGLRSSCSSSQQADGLGAPLSISAHKECEFGPCNMSILQNHLEPPCILKPSNTQARPFDQRESLPTHVEAENQNQGNEKETERKPQRVSQIRIRKTIPKPDPNLTPMGLPKPKRINKKEFSLEDIYTNKNYKSPPPARSLETIFEEPKEKNGVLVSVSQTKRKRILEFRDCTVPRPKRAKGKVRVMNTCKRGRKAAMEGVQMDALLIQKLMDLENFLLEQETLERGSAVAEKPS